MIHHLDATTGAIDSQPGGFVSQEQLHVVHRASGSTRAGVERLIINECLRTNAAALFVWPGVQVGNYDFVSHLPENVASMSITVDQPHDLSPLAKARAWKRISIELAGKSGHAQASLAGLRTEYFAIVFAKISQCRLMPDYQATHLEARGWKLDNVDRLLNGRPSDVRLVGAPTVVVARHPLKKLLLSGCRRTKRIESTIATNVIISGCPLFEFSSLDSVAGMTSLEIHSNQVAAIARVLPPLSHLTDLVLYFTGDVSSDEEIFNSFELLARQPQLRRVWTNLPEWRHLLIGAQLPTLNFDSAHRYAGAE